jgi:hypothetical protein
MALDPIDLTVLFETLDISNGNTTSGNQYEFFNGVLWGDTTTTYSAKEFFDKIGGRYEFFKSYESEKSFYAAVDDNRIYDYYTFYKYAGEYFGTTSGPPPPTVYSTGVTTYTSMKVEIDGGVYKWYMKIIGDLTSAGLDAGQTPWNASYSSASPFGNGSFGNVSPGQYTDWVFIKNVTAHTSGHVVDVTYVDNNFNLHIDNIAMNHVA